MVREEPQDRGSLSLGHGERSALAQHRDSGQLSHGVSEGLSWLVGQALVARRGLTPFPTTQGELAHGGGFVSS